jgi:hypothetical protein
VGGFGDSGLAARSAEELLLAASTTGDSNAQALQVLMAEWGNRDFTALAGESASQAVSDSNVGDLQVAAPPSDWLFMHYQASGVQDVAVEGWLEDVASDLRAACDG